MNPTEFLSQLAKIANFPITQSKDFCFIESSGIRVLEHHHKIAISISGHGKQTQTHYHEPTSELMAMLVNTLKTGAKSHQQRLADDRINHFKNMRNKKNV
ncbi:hypothetical protein [Aeromonas dhakensis]|uniref:hypothetical protein n=1 Tax=Aeromonas dhakensis TaxID=196024 RepID=UPI002B49B617|nr:hypothetical protein [Aeromonas dhakensis]